MTKFAVALPLSLMTSQVNPPIVRTFPTDIYVYIFGMKGTISSIHTSVLNGDTSQNCSIFWNKLIEVGFSVSLRVSLILFAVEFFIGSIFLFYSLSQDLVRYVVFQLPLFMI